MRVLPHVLISPSTSGFDEVRNAVLVNGITTHGHPRALLGATAYAFALWVAATETETLKYGQLVVRLLDGIEQWGATPSSVKAFADWEPVAASIVGDYAGLWASAKAEMVSLLERCEAGLAEAALPIEEETLKDLGVFGAQKGSGIVTAAAAVFLASRFATRPIDGLRYAASLKRADTDTVASMTGGILGSLLGDEWLGQMGRGVQDASYISALGTVTWSAEAGSEPATDVVKPAALKDELADAHVGDPLALPDGRAGKIQRVEELRCLSRGGRVNRFRVETDDGQTVWIKRYSRSPAPRQSSLFEKSAPETRPGQAQATAAPSLEAPKPGIHPSTDERHVQVRFLTADLARVREFYGACLECRLTREGSRFVVFNRVLSFHEDRLAPSGLRPVSHHVFSSEAQILIEVRSVATALERVMAAGFSIVSRPREGDRLQAFICVDPDARPVEVVQQGPEPRSAAAPPA